MTGAEAVLAVIYGRSGDGSLPGLIEAVEGQSARPAGLLVESSLAAGVRAASRSPWIWLLDGRAVPEPDALQALLAAHEIATAPAPALLASMVVDGAGRLHPDALPRHEIFEKTHSVDAAERRLVQLRFAAHGSVLVAGSVLERFGPPRSDLPSSADMGEWTGRVLRSWEDTGYLVPQSTAVRTEAAAAPTWRDWTARVRVLGSTAWGPSERLWEAFVLGGDLVRGGPVSERPAAGRRAARGR